MRVLVLGGTGFIGRHVVQALRARGDEATTLSRRPSAEISADAFKPGEWQKALDGRDAIVNLTGVQIAGRRLTGRLRREAHVSRVDVTRNVVDGIGAAARKPRVLVNASAVGYYGFHGDEDLDESAAPGSDFLARLCVAWEAEAAKARAHGARVSLVRSGVVLSTDGGALPVMARPFKMFVGGRIGSGRQWLPWIHIDDEVGAILRALDDARLDGPVNATAPEPARNADFSRALGRALHRPSALPVPSLAMRVLFGEGADLVLEGQRALPRRLQEVGYPFRFPRLDMALADIFERPGL